MATERWDFVRRFLKSLEMTYFQVTVNGDVYCDIGFPEEEDYSSVIDTCICMVEGDPEYANERVVNTYLNVETNLISFHMGPVRPTLDDEDAQI